MASAKPFVGWATPKRPSTYVVAARAAASLISTDLARTATGPVPSVVAISHDEFQTEVMDAAGFSTLRTFQGQEGFWITNARLKSPAGSDFEFWQHWIAERGLGDRIELLGVRPAREALKRGNHLVVPSLAESLPYVVLEGAAAGRQVIATSVGGIAEIFGPTSYVLVPPRNAAALRAALQRALDDPEGAHEGAPYPQCVPGAAGARHPRCAQDLRGQLRLSAAITL